MQNSFIDSALNEVVKNSQIITSTELPPPVPVDEGKINRENFDLAYDAFLQSHKIYNRPNALTVPNMKEFVFEFINTHYVSSIKGLQERCENQSHTILKLMQDHNREHMATMEYWVDKHRFTENSRNTYLLTTCLFVFTTLALLFVDLGDIAIALLRGSK